MLKAYKYRIFPTEQQQELLARYFGVVRAVYNLALETKINAYKTAGVSLTKFDLLNQLPELKQDVDWIKECPSQALQQAIQNMDTAYTNFFKGRGAFPKFKNKFSKQSLIFPQGVKVDFDNSTIKLPKLGSTSIDFSREFEGTVKRATVSKTVTGKYFVSILVDNNKETPSKQEIREETSVGVDLGIKEFAITSDGIIYKNNNFFKSQQRKLRVEQRSLARKKKGSKSRERQKLKVALLQEKIRNQRIDYLHKISTELIRSYDTIVIEDLAVSNMLKNRKLSKAISDMGWYEFRTMLEYKAEWYGKNLITIGRFEPSSKTCSSCGNIKEDLKLSNRTYECSSCGHEMDRDLNAAINIKEFGLRAEPINRERKAVA